MHVCNEAVKSLVSLFINSSITNIDAPGVFCKEMMMTKATMMTAMMMLILGPQCLRRPWGAHKGQDDVSNPQMRGRSTDMILIMMMMVVHDDTNYLNRTIVVWKY